MVVTPVAGGGPFGVRRRFFVYRGKTKTPPKQQRLGWGTRRNSGLTREISKFPLKPKEGLSGPPCGLSGAARAFPHLPKTGRCGAPRQSAPVYIISDKAQASGGLWFFSWVVSWFRVFGCSCLPCLQFTPILPVLKPFTLILPVLKPGGFSNGGGAGCSAL